MNSTKIEDEMELTFIGKVFDFFSLLRKAGERELVFVKDDGISFAQISLNRQTEMLFSLSEAAHNINNPFFLKCGVKSDDDFYRKISYIFSYSRFVATKIKDGKYSEDQYQDILKYIRTDFYDFCHHKSSELDVEKFAKLVEEKEA